VGHVGATRFRTGTTTQSRVNNLVPRTVPNNSAAEAMPSQGPGGRLVKEGGGDGLAAFFIFRHLVIHKASRTTNFNGNLGCRFFADERGYWPQIFYKLFQLFVARFLVCGAQDRGRMYGGQDIRCDLRAYPLASLLAHQEVTPHNALGGGSSQQHDDVWPNSCNLRVEPRAACADFQRRWFLMDTALAARLPFEVLDDIRDVDLVPTDADCG